MDKINICTRIKLQSQNNRWYWDTASYSTGHMTQRKHISLPPQSMWQINVNKTIWAEPNNTIMPVSLLHKVLKKLFVHYIRWKNPPNVISKMAISGNRTLFWENTWNFKDKYYNSLRGVDTTHLNIKLHRGSAGCLQNFDNDHWQVQQKHKY